MEPMSPQNESPVAGRFPLALPSSECRVGRGGAYALPPPARSNGSCSFCFAAPSVSRKPLSCVVVSMNGGGIAPLPSVSCRGPGFLDVGAGSFALRTYPHFRHVLTPSSTLDAATQHGAFPLRPAFWARSASSLAGDDPEPFVPTPFQSTVPRSDSWHRIGRNFAHAYIRTYRRVAPGRALHSLLLALSSASVALFQPYLPLGRYQASLSHLTLFPTVSPAHTLVRRGGTQTPSPP